MRVPRRRPKEVTTARVLAPIGPPRRPDAALTVAVLVYRGATTAELDEPVRQLADRLDADVVFVGERVGRIPGVEPARPILVTHTPADAPSADVLVVPGGLGWKRVIDDHEIRSWLETSAASARGILAMSTGTLLLASVGRLAGREATGHWLAEHELAELGAHVSPNRSAHDEMGRVVTASGAMAALGVIGLLADSTQWAR
ncbi:MAG: DJ-1/PfpI family protein [Actinomycetota bacterium]